MKKGILFDLDGTLWDSAGEVARSWNMALGTLDAFSVQITREDMMHFMGNLLFDIGRKMLPKNLSDARVREIVDLCISYEHAHLRAHGAPLYENLRETLDALRKDYSLCIVSNCQAGYIEVFLDYYGLWDMFCDYECPGRTGLLKADNIRLVCERNRLDAAVYIGDTDGDYNAACRAGVPFLHAAYGYGKPHEPTPVLRRLDALPKQMQSIL